MKKYILRLSMFNQRNWLNIVPVCKLYALFLYDSPSEVVHMSLG